MWFWRRIEKISWTDHVRYEDVLLGVSEQRNILHAIRKRKANWIGHILRRNCLLKQVALVNICAPTICKSRDLCLTVHIHRGVATATGNQRSGTNLFRYSFQLSKIYFI
jgi:hypothetical protein